MVKLATSTLRKSAKQIREHRINAVYQSAISGLRMATSYTISLKKLREKFQTAEEEDYIIVETKGCISMA
jgi:hypothetical protein